MNSGLDQIKKSVLIPLWDKPEPFFEFSGKDRNLLVARYEPRRVIDDKRESCIALASSQNAVNRIFPNAIEVTSPAAQMARGGTFFFGFFVAAFALFFLFFLGSMIRDSASFGLMLVPFIGFFIFTLAAIWIFRAPFIQPTDLPVIFNKKTRQVSFMKMRLPNLLKFWAPLRTEYKTYSWDQAKVRSYQVTSRAVGTRAITSSTAGRLCILWGNDPGAPAQFKDWAAVGFNAEDERLLQLWEHIRRYMEEGGPAINPGEELHKGVYDSKWNAPAPQFPSDVLAAAGGRPLSDT